MSGQNDFGAASAQELAQRLRTVETALAEQKHQNDLIVKRIDDVLWMQSMEDVATVRKIRYVGPTRFEANATAQAAGIELMVYGYVFIPKDLDRSKKHPLLVFVHGGVHSNVRSDDYTSVMRELMAQGYVVVAPDYRGSTGYGSSFYNQIDYGGKEIEDVYFARQWMLEEYDFVDAKRVGIFGWSHGGFLTLWNAFKYPDAYQVAFAGVPVSNLALRAGTKAKDVKGYPVADYGAPSSIGKSAFDNVQEYVRRSPAYNADMLHTPLLIHTATNDSDVNVFEVQQLIEALAFRGKKFEYKIFDNPPGEHHFELIDTKAGREARAEIYQFLARHLKPAK
jgi:dipeptidyl aminopeptidase/acylaminoacyl peptidase